MECEIKKFEVAEEVLVACLQVISEAVHPRRSHQEIGSLIQKIQSESKLIEKPKEEKEGE